jgi:hypothetical protein
VLTGGTGDNIHSHLQVVRARARFASNFGNSALARGRFRAAP